MAVSFGCTTASPSWGVANSQSSTATAEIAQARNAAGLVTNEQAYSRTVKNQCTAVFDGAVPAAGASATVFGSAGLVESVAVTENNTGYKMADVTITKSDANAGQTVLA
jgi:hypothetical protein